MTGRYQTRSGIYPGVLAANSIGGAALNAIVCIVHLYLSQLSFSGIPCCLLGQCMQHTYTNTNVCSKTSFHGNNHHIYPTLYITAIEWEEVMNHT